MTKQTKRYKRQVYKNLHCDRKTRRALMDDYRKFQEHYLEDVTNPTWEQLCKAFGAPSEMAASLMANISPKDQMRYLHQRKCRRIGLGFASGMLFAMLVSLTIFALATREVIIVVEEIIRVIE